VRDWKILLRHILPNVAASVVIISSFGVASAIISEAFLSFLGLGVKPPATSWGAQLQNAQAYLGDAPRLALIPGLLIVVTVLRSIVSAPHCGHGQIREASHERAFVAGEGPLLGH